MRLTPRKPLRRIGAGNALPSSTTGFHLNSNDTAPIQMTTDEQRQILYAALLRYSPETGSLRDRALDRFVLVALLGSSESEPMTTSQVQSITVLAPKSPGLRTDVIEETLDRLVNSRRVATTPGSPGTSYYLTNLGKQHTDEATESAAELFRPVLKRMLQHTDALFSAKDGETVCRTFISECFARFGHQIAKAVAGDLREDGTFGGADVNGAFEAAIQKVSLSHEAIQTLRSRCNRFLRSMEPEDKDLRFRLAQSYYVVQLLELSPHDFNPLADDAFSGAVFYLDTNIVLDAIKSDDFAERFHELVSASNSLDIELRVTGATLDEALTVASRRIQDIEKVISTLPRKLFERTKDDFFLAFRAAGEADPSITPADFLRRFEELPSFLRDLNVTIDERRAEEIVNGRDVERQCRIVSDAAEHVRGSGKSDAVSLHDVCHFLLAQEERKNGRKSWFLTRDSTLSHAAVQLAPNELPFCFPLVAFLQSVSPFLESPSARHSLVDIFSAVLEGEVGDLSGRSLFDMSELRLISELHADVLSVPTDQLIPALDYVKSNLLKGRSYRREDHTSVALEIRKFLTSSAHEKQQELFAQIERQKQQFATEHTKRSDAEQYAERLRAEVDRLTEAVDAAEFRDAARDRNQKILAAALALLGVVFASFCWWFDTDVSGRIVNALPNVATDSGPLVALTIRMLGAFAFVSSVIPSLSRLPKRSHRQLGYTIAVAIAIGAADLFGLPSIKAISAYLAFAAPIGSIILFFVERRPNRPE